MKNTKKYIISFLGFLVLAAGIVAGTYLVSKNQDIREKAAPATSLSFNPSTLSRTAGQAISLSINADTGENKITGIDIEITYDPAVIQLTQMSPTSAIANLTGIIKNGVIDNTVGKARFAAYTADKTQGVFGNIDMVTLTGTVLSTAGNGNYPIAFSATTTIAAADEGQNVIINSIPAVLTVSSTGGATEATATPVVTATPSPTTAGGLGGANITLPTATATSTATTKATAVSTATSTIKALATLPPDVPVTGISYPLIGGMILGFGAIVFSLFLAF